LDKKIRVYFRQDVVSITNPPKTIGIEIKFEILLKFISKDMWGKYVFLLQNRVSFPKLRNYRELCTLRNRLSIRREDKLRNRVKDSYTGINRIGEGVVGRSDARRKLTRRERHSFSERRELKRGAPEEAEARRRKRGDAGGKPIDSRNTLGHALLPHPASGFYLLDTHQSRISAWSGLRMKLMWGRASRVWEARRSGHRLASGLIVRVYRGLKKRGREKSDTGGCRLRDIFVRPAQRKSSLDAL
jgi:hypothetical protein